MLFPKPAHGLEVSRLRQNSLTVKELSGRFALDSVSPEGHLVLMRDFGHAAQVASTHKLASVEQSSRSGLHRGEPEWPNAAGPSFSCRMVRSPRRSSRSRTGWSRSALAARSLRRAVALCVGYVTVSRTVDLSQSARLAQENARLAQQLSELNGRLSASPTPSPASPSATPASGSSPTSSRSIRRSRPPASAVRPWRRGRRREAALRCGGPTRSGST